MVNMFPLFSSIIFLTFLGPFRTHSRMKAIPSVVKLNVSIHPAYLEALKKHRARSGQSFGFVVETALQKLLGVTTSPGVRQTRGRKPKGKKE